jgi:hypothetical protein
MNDFSSSSSFPRDTSRSASSSKSKASDVDSLSIGFTGLKVNAHLSSAKPISQDFCTLTQSNTHESIKAPPVQRAPEPFTPDSTRPSRPRSSGGRGDRILFSRSGNGKHDVYTSDVDRKMELQRAKEGPKPETIETSVCGDKRNYDAHVGDHL